VENKKVKQVLSENWYQWKGGKSKESRRRLSVVEILCMKMGK
jgi:hypothetical protein